MYHYGTFFIYFLSFSNKIRYESMNFVSQKEGIMSKLFLLLVVFFTFSFHSRVYADSCGVFRVVKGDINVKEGGKGDFQKAKVNKKVCAGDIVKAGKDSRSKIVMAGGNEINISPDTEFAIEKYESYGKDKKVLLDVIYGKIRSNVKQKYDNEQSYYRVKTKSAVAGVRGTQFMSSFNPQNNEFKVVTFEGVVEMGKLQGDRITESVVVNPGYQASKFDNNRPSEPVKIEQNEFRSIDRDSNNSGSAEVKAPASTPDQSSNQNDNNPDPSKDPNSNLTGGTDTREPASIGDLPKGGIDIPPPQEIKNLPNIQRDVPIFMDPTRNVAVPTCTNCDKIIQGTKANVKVIVCPPGQNCN